VGWVLKGIFVRTSHPPEQIHSLNDKAMQVKTLDFIIFDDEIVWQTILDNNRFEKYSEIYFDSDLNESFSELFKQI